MFSSATAPRHLRELGGFPVSRPTIDDMHHWGGRGSIASVDAGGLPQSGTDECWAERVGHDYGERNPVTDANVALGRLNPQGSLGRYGIRGAQAAI